MPTKPKVKTTTQLSPKPDPEPVEVFMPRCPSARNGLQCDLAAGHLGDHTAQTDKPEVSISWAV